MSKKLIQTAFKAPSGSGEIRYQESRISEDPDGRILFIRGVARGFLELNVYLNGR